MSRSDESEVFPNVFVAGVSRGGTTSLHNILVQHPEISGGKNKEQWVYNVQDRFETRKKLFRVEFASSSQVKYRLDSTPHYFDSDLIWRTRPGLAFRAKENFVVNRILDDTPEAKFIVSLRHPAERFISEYLMNRHKKKPGLLKNFSEHVFACLRHAVLENANYLNMGRYGSMAERVLHQVDRKRIRFTIFETWVSDYSAEAAKLASFLDLSSPIGETIKSDNSGHRYRTRAEGALGSRFNRRKRIVSAMEAMQDFFAPEIEKFTSVTGIQTPEWISWDPEKEAERLIAKLTRRETITR